MADASGSSFWSTLSRIVQQKPIDTHNSQTQLNSDNGTFTNEHKILEPIKDFITADEFNRKIKVIQKAFYY
jgi:hypothetical protein